MISFLIQGENVSQCRRAGGAVCVDWTTGQLNMQRKTQFAFPYTRAGIRFSRVCCCNDLPSVDKLNLRANNVTTVDTSGIGQNGNLFFSYLANPKTNVKCNYFTNRRDNCRPLIKPRDLLAKVFNPKHSTFSQR